MNGESMPRVDTCLFIKPGIISTVLENPADLQLSGLMTGLTTEVSRAVTAANSIFKGICRKMELCDLLQALCEWQLAI